MAKQAKQKFEFMNDEAGRFIWKSEGVTSYPHYTSESCIQNAIQHGYVPEEKTPDQEA